MPTGTGNGLSASLSAGILMDSAKLIEQAATRVVTLVARIQARDDTASIKTNLERIKANLGEY